MLRLLRRFFKLVFLLVLLPIISALVNTYWHHRAPSHLPVKQHHPVQGHVALSVPSVIASVHSAAKRQFLQGVDLRRAEVRSATQAEQEHTVKPLMDKVLVVPKRFRGV